MLSVPVSDTMPADRTFPNPEAEDIVAMVRDVATSELAPRAAQAEAGSDFPRDVFAKLGELGLLAMPYPEE